MFVKSTKNSNYRHHNFTLSKNDCFVYRPFIIIEVLNYSINNRCNRERQEQRTGRKTKDCKYTVVLL